MVKIRKNEDFKISTCPATKTFRQGDGTSETFVLKSMYLNVGSSKSLFCSLVCNQNAYTCSNLSKKTIVYIKLRALYRVYIKIPLSIFSCLDFVSSLDRLDIFLDKFIFFLTSLYFSGQVYIFIFFWTNLSFSWQVDIFLYKLIFFFTSYNICMLFP